MRRLKEQLHRAVVQLLRVYQSRGLLTFCHVPNGGWRNPVEAAALKALSDRRVPGRKCVITAGDCVTA